jgi:MerR family copper efflux transcriptional regulator
MTRSDTTAPSVLAAARATRSRAMASARWGQPGTVSTWMSTLVTLRVPSHWKVKGKCVSESLPPPAVFQRRRSATTKALVSSTRPTPSGYRNYTPEATNRLAFIRSAQAVGLSLGEIRGAVALRDRGTTPCGHVLDLITARATDLDRRISELQRLRTELGRLVDRAQRLDPADCDPRRVCHLIGPNT